MFSGETPDGLVVAVAWRGFPAEPETFSVCPHGFGAGGGSSGTLPVVKWELF
jgi:hypothetical protein